MLKRCIEIMFFFLSALMLNGCGGGGGGGPTQELKGAEVDLLINDTTIRIGDRVEVEVDISDISNDAALIKLRYPDSLKFIDETGNLEVDGVVEAVTPDVGPRRSTDDQLIYLVFDISRISLGDHNFGKLTFQLRAQDVDFSAHLEVDTDVHEAGKDIEDLFRVNNPLFTAVESIELEIK